MKLDNVEKKVINIYIKKNPSISINYKKKLKIISSIFLDKLHLPLDKFKTLKIGDFGCGSGEFAIFYALCGHKVDGFDFNKISLNYANSLKKKLGLVNVSFYKKNLRHVRKSFDIVSCTATLHHLKNPYPVISSLAKNTKPGGYLILSFGLLTSNFQHNLMKMILRLWGTNDNLIFKNANILFSRHIKRCVKYGLREKSNVIYDQFINPQHNYLDLKKILNLLKNKFTVHTMWPKNFIPRGDSAMNSNFIDENYEIPQSNFYWASKGADDSLITKDKKILNNYKIFKKTTKYFNCPNYKKINASYLKSDIYKYLRQLSMVKNYYYNFDETTKSFFLEVYDLFNFLKRKKLSILDVKKKLNKYKYLFRGTSGLGINYIILKKNTKKRFYKFN